ncbi:uncharacterized protein DS421_20g686780 [Arachis hypogaea]|nr:uncharacterized protein DS421_20g686780 [Arachis hypogaea]
MEMELSFTNATPTRAGTGAAVTLNRRFVSFSSPIHVRTAFLCEFSSNVILRFEFFPKTVEASPTPPPSELHRRHRYPKRKIGFLLFFEFMFALRLSANSL